MFILSTDDRDERVIEAFQKYFNYLEDNKSKFSPNLYALITSDWYFNFNEHKCPHDSWLEKLSIHETSSGERSEIRNTQISIKLLGAYHNGYIHFRYINVSSYKFDCFDVKNGHHDWRYDEIRASEDGQIIHEIEWSDIKNSARWIIFAEDIEYEWEPF